MSSSENYRDKVQVVVSNDNLVSGWDIISIKVDGRPVPKTRKGEFETEQDAVEAGVVRGAEHAKGLSQ